MWNDGYGTVVGSHYFRTNFLINTFRGVCKTYNMFPPWKIYKNNTKHHFFKKYLADEWFNGSTWFPYFSEQLNNHTIHGFPSLKMNVKIINEFIPTQECNEKSWIKECLNAKRRVKVNEDMDYPILSKSPLVGNYLVGGLYSKFIKFAIHNPWDVPSPYMRWHHIVTFKDLVINIDPQQTIQYPIDDDLAYKIFPSTQCHSTTGKELRFFEYYTRQNCLLECFMEKALKECGCVLLYMPHNATTRICSDDGETYCVRKVTLRDYYDVTDKNSVYTCDCLPSCNDTEYKVMSIETQIKNYEDPKDLVIRSNHIHIYFRDSLFHPKIRTRTFSSIDLIDNTIYYFDMFLGISLFTIIEIFYYIVLYVIDCLKKHSAGKSNQYELERF
ncbi:hypothetical protein LSTR_LSTR006594 [Laodelphax striatellus]|uniref:Uncharacterized protein n=1 Tax=Laodelphax striatellus TaxID=195883 RepID=A0A482WZP5_LAOST|nr:hypothetical protein LSTR_LSTR006594 [Laodelphax striatellus]